MKTREDFSVGTFAVSLQEETLLATLLPERPSPHTVQWSHRKTHSLIKILARPGVAHKNWPFSDLSSHGGGRDLEPQVSRYDGGSNSSKSHLAILRAEETNLPWQDTSWQVTMQW